MTNKTIKVSMIVVTRNSVDSIENVIASLVSQGFHKNEFEIIISDGFSDDGTLNVAKECLSKYDVNSQLILNSKRSLSAGWNLALKNASGEYVVRPDAHAVLLKGYVKSGILKLDADLSLAGVGGVLITKSSSMIGNIISKVLSSKVGVGNSLFRTGVDKDTISDTAVYAVYRRCVFQKVGEFNEKLGRNQDIDMHKRMYDAGYKLLTSPEMQAIYHTRNSLSAFIRQAFFNGFWVANSDVYHLRHLAPLFFVLTLVSTSFISTYISLAAIFIYFFVLLSYHIILGKEYNIFKLFLLFFVTFMLHGSYGIGSIFGFLRRSQKLII